MAPQLCTSIYHPKKVNMNPEEFSRILVQDNMRALKTPPSLPTNLEPALLKNWKFQNLSEEITLFRKMPKLISLLGS